jgi:hypothetical protein
MPKTKQEDSKENSNVDNSLGPSLFSRDENGLLKNVQYSFNDDGSINWRAMVGEEHLFPNRGWFQSRGKDTPRSIDGLADYQLLIKLSGIKELAKLRGFSDVSYETVRCELDHVAVVCKMTFLSNYETFGSPVEFQDMANATLDNTSSFATKFLETIACNRAFVRCVRNFLQVHIVGDDEIDKSDSSGTPSYNSKKSKSGVNPLSPTSLLKHKAEESLGCESFEDFRKKYIKTWWQEKTEGIYQNDAVKDANSWEDIPGKETRVMLGLIN